MTEASECPCCEDAAPLNVVDDDKDHSQDSQTLNLDALLASPADRQQ